MINATRSVFYHKAKKKKMIFSANAFNSTKSKFSSFDNDLILSQTTNYGLVQIGCIGRQRNKKLKSVSVRVENILGKGEYAGY